MIYTIVILSVLIALIELAILSRKSESGNNELTFETIAQIDEYQIRKYPELTVAAISFNGMPTRRKLDQKHQELVSFLNEYNFEFKNGYMHSKSFTAIPLLTQKNEVLITLTNVLY